MQRKFILLSYDGTKFKGWQKQPNERTIQSELEEALSKLHSEKSVEVVGCGRTDTGVHASAYYTHFDSNLKKTNNQLCYKLNAILPTDIAVYKIIDVNKNAHARFDANYREYHYFIHSEKNPFLNKFSFYYRRELNFSKMNEACKELIGKQDFTSFSKLHTEVKNNICEIYVAEWKKTDQGWVFKIGANRFLRNMVRAIVGTLIEVGLENINCEEFKAIIECRDRCNAGASAPPQGLFLAKIKYPYEL